MKKTLIIIIIIMAVIIAILIFDKKKMNDYHNNVVSRNVYEQEIKTVFGDIEPSIEIIEDEGIFISRFDVSHDEWETIKQQLSKYYCSKNLWKNGQGNLSYIPAEKVFKSLFTDDEIKLLRDIYCFGEEILIDGRYRSYSVEIIPIDKEIGEAIYVYYKMWKVGSH